MNSLIRSLIRETLLTEEVYGAQAIVYHGTKADPQKLITALLYKAKIEPGKTEPSQEELDKEFQPGIGAGAMYGKGLYAVYDLKRLEDGSYTDTQTAAGEYGPSIIKLKVNLYGYIIFDPFVASTVYKKPLTVVEQAEMLGLNKKLIEKLKNVRTEERNNTSDAALEASKFLKGRVKGLVYTGSRDGRCILAYDATTVAPIAWKAIDDKSWTPVDKNSLKTYFRRRASEDWEEEKYEMSLEKKLKKVYNLPIEERIWHDDLDLRDSNVTSLPDGLKVYGNFDPRATKMTALPAGLEVGGNLHLGYSKFTSLPANLKIGGNLDLRNSKIKSLPAGLEVGGNLHLSYSNITSLPAGLEVRGSLHLNNSEVISLPAGLEVGRDLDLSNSKVTSLPADLKLGGSLYLSNSKVTSLPRGLKVRGALHLKNSEVISLPAGLEVRGSLHLSNSKVTSLPAGLKVGGNLNLGDSKVTSLPAGLEIGNDFYLPDSKDIMLPADLKVSGYIYDFNGNRSQVPNHLKGKLR